MKRSSSWYLPGDITILKARRQETKNLSFLFIFVLREALVLFPCLVFLFMAFLFSFPSFQRHGLDHESISARPCERKERKRPYKDKARKENILWAGLSRWLIYNGRNEK